MTDNKDLNKRFDQLEKHLDKLVVGNPLSYFQNPISRSDEIDLRELCGILWKGKWWIIAITFLFAVAGVGYALSLPNMYKSEGLYAPAQKAGGARGMAGQLGGLASLAGVGWSGGDNNDIDQAMALITSRPFLAKVIKKYNLKSLIMGVRGWNKETGELIWDEKAYDSVAKKWLREPPKGQQAEPSDFETYAKFSKMLVVSFDKKTSMLNVEIEHYSPVAAQEWVDFLIVEINDAFRVRDMAESKKNIDYLKRKIADTSLTQMQAVFYGMIEEEMKTLMLAEVSKEYTFREVVPPVVAERKSKPARAIICVLFVFVGGVLGVIVVVLSFIYRDSRCG